MTDRLPWLLIMDGVVAALLLAMMVFAYRLSRQLAAFRDGKEELRGLIRDLTMNVVRAEQAIGGMKENAKLTGKDLQARIDTARALADELQLISEAGDNMAARIERRSQNRVQSATARQGKPDGFAIRDAENERKDGPADADRLQTKAERDLYDALRGRGDAAGRGKP